MTFGLDALGACSPSFDVASYIKAHPPGWALGCFGPGWPNAFGKNSTNIAQICTEAEVSSVRFHAFWSPAHLPAPQAFIKKWAPHYQNFALKFPHINVRVSPSCEYGNTTTKADIDGWLATLNKLAPNCISVLSPQGGSITVPGVETEWHGTNSAGANGNHASLGTEDSTDGNSLTDIDAATWINQNKNSDICFLWGALFNLNPGNNITNPSARTFSPGLSYMKGVAYLANPVVPSPSPQFPVTKLVQPNLWKTFSDWDGNTTQRDFKPMLWLINEAPSPIQIVTFDNQLICTLGHFSDVRWYSGLGDNVWAYQMAQKAMAISGSSHGFAKAPSGNYYDLGDLGFRGFFYE